MSTQEPEAPAEDTLFTTLSNSLQDWWAAQAAGEQRYSLRLGGIAGREVTLQITEESARRLSRMLHNDRHAMHREAESSQRIAKMTEVMVRVRRAGADLGDVLAAALEEVAKRCERTGGAQRLVTGRPGSWEAAIVVEMAETGTRGVRPADLESVRELAELLNEMAYQREDGGDAVSLALGHAANELGSITALVGRSYWRERLTNLAVQYASSDLPDNPLS